MFRKRYLALTYAAGEEFFDKPDFWIYLDSICRLDDVTKVVLTHDMSEEVRQRIRDMHVNVHKVDPKEMQFISRDRHLAYWNFMLDHGHKYEYTIITDSRDVYFQSSPFDWIKQWKSRFNDVNGDLYFLDHFLIITSEGFNISASGWNCIEQFEFQRDVPEPFHQEDRKREVANGGVILGTHLAVKHHLYLMWIATLKSIGTITDQAALNWMHGHLQEDDTYSLSSPHRDWLCVTGEGVKEGFVDMPILKDGKWCNSYLKEQPPYCIIHQWDRVSELKNWLYAEKSPVGANKGKE